MILKGIARERELTNKRIEKTAQDTMVAIRQQLIQRRMGAKAQRSPARQTEQA